MFLYSGAHSNDCNGMRRLEVLMLIASHVHKYCCFCVPAEVLLMKRWPKTKVAGIASKLIQSLFKYADYEYEL